MSEQPQQITISAEIEFRETILLRDAIQKHLWNRLLVTSQLNADMASKIEQFEALAGLNEAPADEQPE